MSRAIINFLNRNVQELTCEHPKVNWFIISSQVK